MICFFLIATHLAFPSLLTAIRGFDFVVGNYGA
jgi:hypothetical protein